MTPETASPHVWQRIAEATQKQFEYPLDLDSAKVESHFNGGKIVANPIVLAELRRQTEAHGVILA